MKTQIERAEPSREAPQMTPDQFYRESDWHTSLGVAAKDMPPALIVTSRETAFAFAEDYAKAGHVVLLEALRLMVDWFGAAHEEACPKDATCHCEGRPINDAVNAAIRSTQESTQPQIGLLRNTMQPWIKKVYAALEADEAEAAIKQAERT